MDIGLIDMATKSEIEKILQTADTQIDLARQMKERGYSENYEIFRSDAIAYLNVARYLVNNL